MDGAISVVIPAYNRAGLIGETLRSLLNQTVPALEIIVVDDGSTDSTAEAVESEFSVFSRQLAGNARIPEFKVIRQENAGPGAARNRGFAESKGEFIHFFDSDDIAAPNKHEVQVRALQESGADIAYGPWVKGRIVADEPQHGAWSEEHGAGSRERGAGGKERGAWSGERGAGSMERGIEAKSKRYSFEPEGQVFQQRGLPKGDLIKELLTRWSIVPQACLFRRSMVENSGGFPNDLFIAEDQLMFLRCLLGGAQVIHTPETIAFYRLGDAGKLTESATASSRRVTDWLLFLERGALECRAKGINPYRWRGFDHRLWTARRSMRSGSDGESGPAARICYPLLSTLDRWRDGLRMRLKGHRPNVSYRCGPIAYGHLRLFPVS
jgi:glycosyltransferase involved in cell wall biosynthesis